MPQISQLSIVFSSQLFWLTVSFGIIFFGIGLAMLPKIRSTVVAREKQIAADLERAKAARAAAEEIEAAWRAKMDEARIEAARLAQEGKRTSALETEARVKAAMEEIDAKAENARLRIRASIDAARAEMEATVTEAAQQIVEQLTGLKVDHDEAARAVAAELERESATLRRGQRASAEPQRELVASRAR